MWWLLLLQSTGCKATGFSCCGVPGSAALGMWNLPGAGIEPMSLASASRFPTTGPPGKSPNYIWISWFLDFISWGINRYKSMKYGNMVGWHHWPNGHEFEQTSGDSEGQRSLGCCSPWGRKESDMTEWLNNSNRLVLIYGVPATICFYHLKVIYIYLWHSIVMYRCESWNHKEGWAPKNWRFQTVVLEKTLESPLDCKEIQPVDPRGNQSWIFIGRTDAEAPILWPPDAKNWLLGKDPDAGKDWR